MEYTKIGQGGTINRTVNKSRGPAAVSRNRLTPKIVLFALVIAIVAVPILSFALPADIVTEFLKVRDPLEPADFIYMLGGDYETRAPAAATLFHHGVSPLIVVAREQAGLNKSLDPDHGFTAISIRMLYKAGVPPSAVVELKQNPPVNSTADEARALRAFVDTRSVRKIVVLTSAIHSRRARIMMRRILWGRDVDVTVWPVEPLRAPPDSEVRKEMTKLLYYSITFW